MSHEVRHPSARRHRHDRHGARRRSLASRPRADRDRAAVGAHAPVAPQQRSRRRARRVGRHRARPAPVLPSRDSGRGPPPARRSGAWQRGSTSSRDPRQASRGSASAIRVRFVADRAQPRRQRAEVHEVGTNRGAPPFASRATRTASCSRSRTPERASLRASSTRSSSRSSRALPRTRTSKGERGSAWQSCATSRGAWGAACGSIARRGRGRSSPSSFASRVRVRGPRRPGLSISCRCPPRSAWSSPRSVPSMSSCARTTQSTRRCFVAMLARLGHTATVANDGLAAWEILQRQSFDLAPHRHRDARARRARARPPCSRARGGARRSALADPRRDGARRGRGAASTRRSRHGRPPRQAVHVERPHRRASAAHRVA